MQWKIVIILGGFGVLMGLASVLGFTERIELLVWIVVAVFAAYWIVRTLDAKVFLHGLCAGLLMGIANALLQFLFFDTYLSNNPTSAKQFVDTGGVSPRVFVLLAGPFIGLFYGAFIGVLNIAGSKILKGRSRSNF